MDKPFSFNYITAWYGSGVTNYALVEIYDNQGWEYTETIEEAYRVSVGFLLIKALAKRLYKVWPGSDTDWRYNSGIGVVGKILEDEFETQESGVVRWPELYLSRCDVNRMIKDIYAFTDQEIKSAFYESGGNIYGKEEEEGFSAFRESLRAAMGKGVLVTYIAETVIGLTVTIGEEERKLYTKEPNNVLRFSDCGIKEDGVKITVTLDAAPTEAVKAFNLINTIDVPIYITSDGDTTELASNGKLDVSVDAQETEFAFSLVKPVPPPIIPLNTEEEEEEEEEEG